MFHDVEVVTWDRSGLYGGTGPGGVIGNPLFADLLLTLDLGKGEVRIARGEVVPGPDVVTYEPSEGGVFRIPVSIGTLKIVTPGAPAPAPVKVAAGALGDYARRFGIRTITSKGGDLFFSATADRS